MKQKLVFVKYFSLFLQSPKSILVILGLLITMTTASAANFSEPILAGWDSGNAGDTYANEFRLTALDVIQKLEYLNKNGNMVYDTAPLRAALYMTNVKSKDLVVIDGTEVDAANYPNQFLIEVNRKRWKELRKSTETRERLRLALHEFLWVSRVNDLNFEVSNHLIDLLNLQNYSPNIWWNPVNPINRIQLSLEYAPTGCTLGEIRFTPGTSAESLFAETQGTCEDSFRRVEISKVTAITPPSSQIKGFFNTFDIKIYDRDHNLKSEMRFEPEWGVCLLPDTGACRGSGTMTLGGIEIIFMLVKDRFN